MTLAHSHPDELIGGSVESVHRIRLRLEALADVAGGGRDHVGRLRSHSWVGRAGDAFRSAVGEVPAKLDDAARSFREAAAAVERYADVLAAAKRAARRAIDLAADGEVQTRTWDQSWDRYRAAVASVAPGVEVSVPVRPSRHDPGAGLRAAAEQVLDDARRRLDDEAHRLASVLEQAGSRAPDKPGLLSRAWGGITQFGLGAWDATYGMAEFAWSMSPTRMLLDPEGWTEDVALLGQGIWFGVQNPVEFAKAITNWDMWMDNPARALGQLVPDLVLTLATAGGSAAATGVRRGADAADSLSDLGRAANRLDEAADFGEAIRHIDDLVPADGAGAGRRPFPQPRPDDPGTPLVNLTEAGDLMGDYAANVPPLEHALDIAVHGSPYDFAVNGVDAPALSHRDVARLIEGNAKYTRQDIRLLSCSSGACADGAAQNLANRLGVNVTAPNRTLWVYPDGRLVVGEGVPLPTGLEIVDPGEWVQFRPGGGRP